MKNYMISTDGVFGKKTDNGDVRLDHSGHYNIHKPDNVAVTDGSVITVKYPGGMTRFKTEDGATIQQSVQYKNQFTI